MFSSSSSYSRIDFVTAFCLKGVVVVCKECDPIGQFPSTSWCKFYDIRKITQLDQAFNLRPYACKSEYYQLSYPDDEKAWNRKNPETEKKFGNVKR